jgi:hypothetical protein
MCLRAAHGEGPTAAAGAVRSAQAVGQLVEHATIRAELKSVCTDAVCSFLSITVLPLARRFVLSPRALPPAAAAAATATPQAAGVDYDDAAETAGPYLFAEALAFELASRTIRLDPFGFTEHDLWDLLLLSPRLCATFHSEFTMGLRENNLFDSLVSKAICAPELSAILANHVTMCIDASDSVDDHVSKRRRLGGGDASLSGRGGLRNVPEALADAAQLFRREAKAISSSFVVEKFRLDFEVLVGMAEYFGKIFTRIQSNLKCSAEICIFGQIESLHFTFGLERWHAITNLLVKVRCDY